jgi:formylglycine-generating enzyme required for sulfatase activity
MKNPIDDKKDSSRVLCGGCWLDDARFTRMSDRGSNDDPTAGGNYIGFRLVKNIPQEKK